MIKNVQVRVDGLASVQISTIFTLPAKRLTGHTLQPGQIDPPSGKHVHLVFREIITNHRHQPYICEQRGGNAAVGGSSAHDPPIGVLMESNATEPTVKIGCTVKP